MPTASALQSNFNSGEIDPKMYGRVDYERMRSALKVCKNMIPRVTGSITRRPGFYFCDEVKDSTKATRTYTFKFNTTQAYVIEMGDQYFRFKKNHGPVYQGGIVISGATTANPVVVTYVGADALVNGDQIDISDVVGMTEINGRRFIVANVNVGANTIELTDMTGANVNGTAYTAYSSAGTISPIYTLTTPYLEADLFELKFAQNADTLYIWHPDYNERTLVRVNDADWTLATTTRVDGPYMLSNATTTTLTPSGFTVGTGRTLTASSIVGINNGEGFKTTDVGRLIRIFQSPSWGYVQITGWTSTTVVTVTIINSLTSTAAKTIWRMGLWSDTTGYPACGTFYGDRLYRGGSTEQPDRLDGSYVGDYLNMAPSDIDRTVVDANAVSFRLNSNDVQSIRWMLGTASGLACGTFEGEWLVSPSTNQEAITPTNVNAKQSTSWGSANVLPVRVGVSIIFIEAGNRRVREMVYLYYENVLQSPDLTILAEHITKGLYDPADHGAGASSDAQSGVIEITFTKKPIPCIWGVRRDGHMVGCTFSKDEKVAGWHRHASGGYSNAGQTLPAKIESLTVAPVQDGSYDEVWAVVNRYIGGRTVRSNEFMGKAWEQGDSPLTAYFVDGGLTYSGTPVSSVVAHHLAGETVSVIVDGAVHPDVTVSALGVATLNQSASVIHLGYTYQSDGETLRFDVGAADGTAQGKTQRIHQVAARFHDTGGCEFGPSFANMEELIFREADDLMDVAIPLFSGDKQLDWNGDYSTEASICWRFQSPLPGEILMLAPRLQTQDRG